MPRFVDFGKRGVSLPHGCKDLADVLRLERQDRAALSKDMKSSEGDHRVMAGVESVRRLVELLFKPGSELSSISVSVEGFDSPLMLHFDRQHDLREVFVMTYDVALQDAMLRFFSERGIPLGFSEVAGDWAVLSYALPVEIEAAAELVRELLRAAYDVQDGATLKVRFTETFFR